MTNAPVTIVGGGLAGCEAALQLARRGIPVVLREQKPEKRTPAQVSDGLAELVCSNSFRSRSPENAVGLIKEEMRRLGSFIMVAADACEVPAGDALAVDRDKFSATVTAMVEAEPLIQIVHGEVTDLPDDGDVIVATGPLTSDALAERLRALTGSDSLYFYDSIAPILDDESIDRSIVYALSRHGKGGGDDYLNCPMDEAQYRAFHHALLTAERVALREFEKPVYFPGCLPIEVMADSGYETLRYGPMKPVGLPDPRTGEIPYAVVQLRKENKAGTAWNMVGFQTKLKYPEQKRVFRSIPGLERVEFLRMGSIHRNTFLHSPTLLDDENRLKARPSLRFAGQITGVEGYVESTASGLMTALYLARRRQERPLPPPPRTTALGALMGHVHGYDGADFQPQNINFGLFEPLGRKVRGGKAGRKLAHVERARSDLDAWLAETGLDRVDPG